MRTRIWITGIILLAICCVVLLLQRSAKPKETEWRESGDDVVKTNALEEPRQVGLASTQNPPTPLPPNTLTNVIGFRMPTVQESNAAYQKILGVWQTPIEFYGKVVDESSNPVPRATIEFTWMELPTDDGSKYTNTESSAEGLFSLQNQRGPSLQVLVSKEGYYPRRGGAKYGPAETPEFSANPQNPVIFRLRKKGQPEPLLKLKRNYNISRDGTALAINLENGQTTKGENGNLVVQCWTEDKGKRRGEKYDWRCVVKLPDGGAIATAEEFPFLAPEVGYKPSIEINMPAASTN